MLRHVRLLVFDLDYLIFDCAALREQALRRSLLPYADLLPHDARLPNAADIEEGYRLNGRGWVAGLQVGLGREQLQELARGLEIHEQRLVEAGAGSPYPEIESMLSHFRREGLLLHLGADAGREYLLEVHDKHRLDRYFEASFCAGEFGSGELPEMFEESMHHAGVNPSETVALGTRTHYFAAAHALDIMTVGCGWGLRQKPDLGGAALQCMDPAQVMTAVSRIDLHAWTRFG